MATSVKPAVDVVALLELANRHPDELAALRKAVRKDATATAPLPAQKGGEDAEDKNGRRLGVGDTVTTSQGETGVVKRLDQKSRRALVDLGDGRTRMLRWHRIEVSSKKRGRPKAA